MKIVVQTYPGQPRCAPDCHIWIELDGAPSQNDRCMCGRLMWQEALVPGAKLVYERDRQPEAEEGQGGSSPALLPGFF